MNYNNVTSKHFSKHLIMLVLTGRYCLNVNLPMSILYKFTLIMDSQSSDVLFQMK